MFAHGEDDLREPVYDVTVPPVMTVERANSAGASVAMEKITAENEQTYHIDPKWNGKLLPASYLYYLLVYLC